jgi:pyruvate dehydrogenase E1 component beta subunit
VEVVDPRTLSPLDLDSICNSVGKTRRLVVADPAWASFGAASEIIARVAERMGDDLKANPARVCFPDSHTPMSSALEPKYYPGESDLRTAVCKLF